MQGSEFSPRTHYAIATLVRHVGFPPGVCNFILHRPEDAVETFNTLVSHPAIRKINFTGSTAVGRSIAIQAAKYIKPVILELGGKNVSIVLEDADLERAARESLNAAVENVNLPFHYLPKYSSQINRQLTLLERSSMYGDRHNTRTPFDSKAVHCKAPALH